METETIFARLASLATQMLWKPDFFGGELSVPALTKDECNNQQ